MSKYIATITHHSISRARVIRIDGTLTAAKRAATKEFDSEMQDYRIIICNDDARREVVAARLVGERGWR